MICSITYHYKYLLWFTLLSGCFLLSLSFCLFFTLETWDTSSCSYQWNHSGFLSLESESLPFSSYLLYALSYCCFSHSLSLAIRLLMVFRCCIDSLCACFCLGFSLASSSYLSGFTLEDTYIFDKDLCRSNVHLTWHLSCIFLTPRICACFCKIYLIQHCSWVMVCVFYVVVVYGLCADAVHLRAEAVMNVSSTL